MRMDIFWHHFAIRWLAAWKLAGGGPGRLGGQWQSDIRLRDIFI